MEEGRGGELDLQVEVVGLRIWGEEICRMEEECGEGYWAVK